MSKCWWLSLTPGKEQEVNVPKGRVLHVLQASPVLATGGEGAVFTLTVRVGGGEPLSLAHVSASLPPARTAVKFESGLVLRFACKQLGTGGGVKGVTVWGNIEAEEAEFLSAHNLLTDLGALEDDGLEESEEDDDAPAPLRIRPRRKKSKEAQAPARKKRRKSKDRKE
eukprot:Hpha_TRINITY_DN8682_c0_g1::TRINITY_DN8682_c0_g1_i1::g.168569::m.168569